MVLSHRTQDGIDIVTPPDPFDASVASEARAEVRDLIAGGSTKLIFDMAGVNFVDSSGMSVLVTAVKELRAKSGEVALVQITPRVRSLIETTRLHTVFHIFDDEAAALAAFR